jgi:hypothetical protein
MKNELKRNAKLEVKSTTTYTSPSLVMQPSTVTMSTLTPNQQYEPSQPLLLSADGSIALLFLSDLIHNSYFVEEEVGDNNVKLERQENINSGVTTMDMTVVGPELVNRGVTTMDRTVVGEENSNGGETTVLAGLLRDRKLVVVVEYPRWAERHKLVFNSPPQLSKGGSHVNCSGSLVINDVAKANEVTASTSGEHLVFSLHGRKGESGL